VPWFKVDDGFHGHPKVMDLSLEAVGLWSLAGSWCAKYLTDGFVPEKTIRRLGGGPDVAMELLTAGLWEAQNGGWQFKDWTDYQPSKVEVEAERQAARDRMKKVRAAKKGIPRSGEQPANVDRSSEEVRLAPSHPIPVPIPVPKKTSPPLAEEFDKFWGEYPRKEGKGDARKAFAAARKKTDLDTIMSGLNRYKLASLLIEKQFVKMPGPWLRAERWDDEPVAGTPSPELVKDVFCRFHDYYPMPCAKCAREEGENAF
jgi:hypothetical protein